MRIPLWLKIGWTLWLIVWAPVYWRQYGAQNFLFFCDIGNVIGMGLWLESDPGNNQRTIPANPSLLLFPAIQSMLLLAPSCRNLGWSSFGSFTLNELANITW